jgi:5'-3' exonuclease
MSGKTVLVDYNNLCYRLLFTRDVGVNVPGAVPNFTLWRFMVLDAIYQLMLRFEPSEVVLAVDNKNTWRKSYFPRYKESRKKRRDKDDGLNWELIFGMIEKFQKELKHHFPFKIMKIRSAEADDVIAIIAMDGDKDSIISSNDEDFLQLCSARTQIWNPSKHEIMTVENTDEFLVGKCLMGQSKDDIFNVLTPNDWGMTEQTEGKRKPGLGPATVEKILQEGVDKWLSRNKKKKFDVIIDPEQNYKRNEILIDFRKIPKTIRDRVLDAYYDYSFPPPSNMYPFLKKHKMRGFIEEYPKFERYMMKLYE